jgi:L-amino acid N-acyltransferase YncA
VEIVPLTAAHAEAVLAIYQLGIDEGESTFETTAPSWEVFDRSRLRDHRFVAVDDAGTGNQVLGWVAASPVSSREAYAGVVEHSVYVHPDARGRGVGAALLRQLIASTEAAGIWTVQGVLFAGNAGSLALHERLGFRVVGCRERIARLRGEWRDTLLVERRSPVAGR